MIRVDIPANLGFIGNMDPLLIITTGGTIDKVYFDAKSQYSVGEPQIGDVLRLSHVDVGYEILPLFQKDSLEMTDADRQIIKEAVLSTSAHRILITHGTDTMTDTAKFLGTVPGKTIVLTGALLPARFRDNDAIFNIGFAMAAMQTLSEGTYLCMNGHVYLPDRVIKDREKNRGSHCIHHL